MLKNKENRTRFDNHTRADSCSSDFGRGFKNFNPTNPPSGYGTGRQQTVTSKTTVDRMLCPYSKLCSMKP